MPYATRLIKSEVILGTTCGLALGHPSLLSALDKSSVDIAAHSDHLHQSGGNDADDDLCAFDMRLMTEGSQLNVAAESASWDHLGTLGHGHSAASVRDVHAALPDRGGSRS